MLTCTPWFREHDNWWYCTLRVDGKQRQRKLVQGRDNEKVAHDLYHKLMLQLGPERPHALSLPALCKQFLEAHVDLYAPSTYDWYHRYLELFCNHHPGEAVSVTPSEVLAWTRTHDWNDSSVRGAITTLKRVLNWAVEERKLAASPLAGMKRPACGCREQLISAEEHKAMLAKSDRHFANFLRALRGTGARPGELRALTREMVKLDRGVWELPKHKTVRKTGKPRVIYLSPAMIALTKELLAEMPPECKHVFRNRFNKPWTVNAVRLRMQRLRKFCKLPTGTIAYAYRHTFATEALDAGIAPQHVAKLLGHQNLEMLSRYYDHGDQKTDTLKLAAARAADVLGV